MRRPCSTAASRGRQSAHGRRCRNYVRAASSAALVAARFGDGTATGDGRASLAAGVAAAASVVLGDDAGGSSAGSVVDAAGGALASAAHPHRRRWAHVSGVRTDGQGCRWGRLHSRMPMSMAVAEPRNGEPDEPRGGGAGAEEERSTSAELGARGGCSAGRLVAAASVSTDAVSAAAVLASGCKGGWGRFGGATEATGCGGEVGDVESDTAREGRKVAGCGRPVPTRVRRSDRATTPRRAPPLPRRASRRHARHAAIRRQSPRTPAQPPCTHILAGGTAVWPADSRSLG